MGAVAQKTVLRLDKWLWYARFFKTRSAANKAISGGRFRVDGIIMTKPHRQALCGQVLTFVQGDRIRVIEILALGGRRGPAVEAESLYKNLAPVKDLRAKKTQVQKFEFEVRGKGSGRPTKRLRRATDRLKVILNDNED
ncbi:S4 domain-containing protein [Candidatus Puniceispirillum sp.]|nr:S4 domain-containing protein [Candidatus Puniceispirillum sp.]